MRDELLNGEIFYSLWEAQINIKRGRNHFNTKRPHSALGYRPPAPDAAIPMDQRPSHALTFKLDHSSGAAQDM
jgi:transposase InsO family protein